MRLGTAECLGAQNVSRMVPNHVLGSSSEQTFPRALINRSSQTRIHYSYMARSVSGGDSNSLARL